MSSQRSLWRFIISILAAGGFVAIAASMPDAANAQMDKVKTSMESLKAKTEKLGEPKVEGKESVAGKEVPGLYFGKTKMNNSFDVVDAVAREHGGVATLFVKAGDEYVRVATNVKKDDGTRAVGTVLDPKGQVIALIKKGESYYGDANILGKPYLTGYEPIKDASGEVIGIHFVGYPK